MRRFELPLDWPLLLALSLTCWVASFSHEFTHHLVVNAVCGEPGRMSLNRFVLPADCRGPWPLATAAGPALSYLMMWTGAWLLRRGQRPLLGFALVVAYIPFLRLLTAAMGGGDEGLLLRTVFPGQGRWLAVTVVLALILPPLWTCWQALANRWRAAVFAGAFLLPILPLLPVPSRDAVWYGDWLAGALWLPNAFGVPWSVWAVHAVMIGLCLLAWWSLRLRRMRTEAVAMPR